MVQPTLTHESRRLLILVGGVLGRCIENRARTIAVSQSQDDITPENVEQAITDFFREELSDLPRFVQQAMNKFGYHSSKAA